MRIFIAIDVPEHVRQELIKLQEQLPREHATLTLPKQFHLTLKFIGDDTPEQTEQIKQALETITFQPFELTLDDIGFFPTPQHINVIWVGVTPHEFINALQQQIEKTLLSITPASNKFHPHLTLARVKSITNKQAFIQQLNLNPQPLVFTAEQIHLVESKLTTSGSTYKTLASYPAKPL